MFVVKLIPIFSVFFAQVNSSTDTDTTRVLNNIVAKRQVEINWFGNADEGEELREDGDGSNFRSFFRLTRNGFCQAGKVYQIKNGHELPKYEKELECIFQAGLSPTKVPQGPLYGRIVSILNTLSFSHIVNLFWWGKLTSPHPCNNGAKVYIGWNNLLSHLLVPFIASVGPLNEKLASGEINDGRDSLLIDYTKDFSTVCGHPVNFSGDGKGMFGLNLNMRLDKNIYPMNQIVDALRLVGRQEDGGSIYLGKTYLKDGNKGANTVLYFYFVNYDTEVNPGFGIGSSIPPLSQNIQYTVAGVFGRTK